MIKIRSKQDEEERKQKKGKNNRGRELTRE